MNKIEFNYKLKKHIKNLKRIKKIFLIPLNIILKPFKYKIVKNIDLVDYCLHEYKSYEEYRDIQIFTNKRKINLIFADKKTLKRVFKEIKKLNLEKIEGLCHGTRNGFEQNFLNSLDKNIKVIGTDISETALEYENSIQWDYHNIKTEWINKFDFIYTNSLDQSWKPRKAVEVWLDQLNRNGILIIEHTKDHSPKSADEADPFGVKPTALPYVLTMWFGNQISISHSVEKKDKKGSIDAWLFVISKNVNKVVSIV